MSHWKSSQYTLPICLSDNRDAVFIHVSNCISSCTDLVHIVHKFEIAYGTSWKLRMRSWMKKGEEVKLCLPKTSEMMYMPWIASWKRRNVIGPRNLSLR